MTTEGVDNAAMRLASRQHGALAVRQATACGLSLQRVRHLVDRGALDRPVPNVLRVVGSPATWRQALMMAVLSAGPGAAVSHRAAAALHDLDGFPPGPLEVVVPRPHRERDPQVRVHSTRRLHPVDVTVVDGIPVTTAARTLIDLAAVIRPPRLEEALDGAIRDGIVDPAVLRARIEALRRRGRAGIRVIEALLGEPGEARPHSVLERRFLRVVAAAGLPRPDCQVPVVRADGREARLDFRWPGTRVAVEVDGHLAHATRRQRRADNERANALVLAADLTILRFTYEQVRDTPDDVRRAVRHALDRDARAPSVPVTSRVALQHRS